LHITSVYKPYIIRSGISDYDTSDVCDSWALNKWTRFFNSQDWIAHDAYAKINMNRVRQQQQFVRWCNNKIKWSFDRMIMWSGDQKSYVIIMIDKQNLIIWF